MIQFRNGLGEVDCATNPNDPVCAAYYGTTPTAPQKMRVDASAIMSALMQQANQNTMAPAATAGASIVVDPAAGGAAGWTTPSWWDRIPGWVRLLGGVGILFAGYKLLTK